MATQLQYGDGISDQTLDYLLTVIRSGVNSPSRLAALSVLTELFKTDKNNSLIVTATNNGLVTHLQYGLDRCTSKGMKPPELSDILFSDLSMKVLHKISQMSFSRQQPIIEESVISRLLEYLNIDSNFYRLLDVSKYDFFLQIENKILVAKTKKKQLNSDLTDKLIDKTGENLNGITLPSHLCVCDVMDTSNVDMDVSVKELLTDNEIAWPELKHSKETERKDFSDWTDIIITKNISSMYFWALVGEEAILGAKEVYNLLSSYDKHSLTHVNAVEGELVITKGCLGDEECFLRCEVVKHCGSLVEVFSVDYGLYYSVPCHEVYQLPEKLQLSSHPPNVSLCTYSGVQVAPLEVDTVIYAAATLANISRYSVVAGEILMNLHGVDTFMPLLLCPDPELLHHLINLLNTLACNGRIHEKLRNVPGLIQSVIGIINKSEEFNDMYLMKDTLNCLSNLLLKNEKSRRDFYNSQGLKTVLTLLTQPYIDSSIVLAIRKLLKIFLNSYPANCETETPSRSGSSRLDLKSNQTSGVRHRETGVSYHPNQSPPTKQPNTDLICVKDKDGPGSGSSHQENDIRSCSWSVSSEKQKVKAVNIAEVYRDDSIKRKFFIKDSVVDFQPGMTVEFRPIKTLKSVSASVTAKVVCGMLNSGKGGHIYFGIGKTGEVAGIEANRNDRDEFRIGLDIIMNNQLSPPVFHSLFDIDYFPVVRPTREQEVLEMVPIENLYIIDITVHSSNETVYTCKDKHSYFRFGPNAYPLSVQEVRQLITVDEESKYIEEICKLRRELNSLKFAA